MTTLKLADGMFTAAEAIVTFASNCGLKVTLLSVIQDQPESIALIAAMMRSVVEKQTGETVEVVNNVKPEVDFPGPIRSSTSKSYCLCSTF